MTEPNYQEPGKNGSRQGIRLMELIADLKEEQALSEIGSMLASGWTPTDVMEYCLQAMQEVGKRFESGRYFISGLIMAGELMRRTNELLEINLIQKQAESTPGTILLGTISGDIHNLGKNLFAILVQCEGYHVEDLGVDVSPERFLETAVKIKPGLIGLSCMLTSALPELKATVKLLHDHSEEHRAPVMIGGNCIDQHILTYSNADYWAKDAIQGIRICNRVFGRDC